MENVWKILGKAQLQRHIGAHMMERLEYLLPALQGEEYDNDTIYTKASIIKIFDAFIAPTALANSDFRKEVFNSLPEKEINRLCEKLDISWDVSSFEEKVGKLVKVGWSDSEQVSVLVKELGLNPQLMPYSAVLPPPEVYLDPVERAYKPLKDYQAGVFYDAMARMNIPRSRFIVQMPTGSGKTRTAMEIITSVLNSSPDDAVVIWLAHSEELCEQAYECFRDVWEHVGLHKLFLGRAWGEGCSLPYAFEGRGMIIGGFQKLHASLKHNAIRFKELRKRTYLVVVDEAHKVLAPTYSAVTKALIGANASMIGLTATPGRGLDSSEQNEALSSFFFNQMLTINSGGRGVIEYLRDRKVLSNTTYQPTKTNRNYRLSSKEKAYLEKYFDIPAGVLQVIGSDDVRNVEIIKLILKECETASQVLFFACSVEHSKFIAALLSMLEIAAAHIDGEVPRGRRAGLINAFRENKIQVLCNYGVLSTGFDAPKTDVVFISRPTASIVLYSQMVGRGLRGPAIGGTEKCKVIDLKDNIAGFSDENTVFHYFDEYYDPS